jgi:hypothetical protein
VRSKIAKALRDHFRRELSRRHPAFREFSSADVPPGWRVFAADAAPDLAFYIVLALHSTRDSFTVEGAWTRNGRFPSLCPLLFPRSFPDSGFRQDEPRDGDFRFRLSFLWQPRDYWWDLIPRKTLEDVAREDDEFLKTGTLPPEPTLDAALANLGPMLADALRLVTTHLLPYFDEIAPNWDRARTS